MITDWVNIRRVKIGGAENLYPSGLDWQLAEGVNAIIGGTGLGKTTLVYAIQFAIFEKMIVNAGDRIERDFFKDRLTSRTADEVKANPPVIEVHFELADSLFVVKRNLITGSLVESLCDGTPIKSGTYHQTLEDKIGLTGDFAGLAQVESHLLFFGEGRYLLAWDNLLQNEILNLLLSDQKIYTRLSKLWDDVESLDSAARNISAQASRLEKDIKSLSNTSSVKELERRSRLNELTFQRTHCEEQIAILDASLRTEEALIKQTESQISVAQAAFHETLDTFEREVGVDVDDVLLNTAENTTPTIASVRNSLESFYSSPNARPCPCCGRSGLAPSLARFATIMSTGARDGNCVVCHKDLIASSVRARANEGQRTFPDSIVSSFQELIFRREQIQSRIEDLRNQKDSALSSLTTARNEEVNFLSNNPSTSVDALKITVEEMRKRQKASERARNRKMTTLRSELKSTNAAFEDIQSDITKAFKKYASLYLDEVCDVALLKEDELPGKKGPQVKAPHSAFFPIVSGHIRQSAQALSDAQRSFIDLAFRMAVVEAWRTRTKKTMTIIVETPEGAVDIAYMKRVAVMLRTFAKQGHTMLITTNLNNSIFLPELLAEYPKAERSGRILNLLELGRPRRVQKAHHREFNKIIRHVMQHAVA